MSQARAYVEAELELSEGLDPAAVGAAVTVERAGTGSTTARVAGRTTSSIDAGRRPARFRTLYVADEPEEAPSGC